MLGMSDALSATRRHHGQSVRHFSQHDLAARWRLSVRTLERWRPQHKGPSFLKLGGRVVYRIEDIEAFEASHRKGTSAD